MWSIVPCLLYIPKTRGNDVSVRVWPVSARQIARARVCKRNLCIRSALHAICTHARTHARWNAEKTRPPECRALSRPHKQHATTAHRVAFSPTSAPFSVGCACVRSHCAPNAYTRAACSIIDYVNEHEHALVLSVVQIKIRYSRTILYSTTIYLCSKVFILQYASSMSVSEHLANVRACADSIHYLSRAVWEPRGEITGGRTAPHE